MGDADCYQCGEHVGYCKCGKDWQLVEPSVGNSPSQGRGRSYNSASLNALFKKCGWTYDSAGNRLRNLIRQDFHGANLVGADLSSADLHYADLGGANLRNANLANSYLWHANLEGANLNGANLEGAKLKAEWRTVNDAKMTGADLTGATMPDGSTHQ